MFGSALPNQQNNPLEIPPTPTPHLGDQVRGYGFLHDGAVPTIFDFFRFPAVFFDLGFFVIAARFFFVSASITSKARSTISAGSPFGI